MGAPSVEDTEGEEEGEGMEVPVAPWAALDRVGGWVTVGVERAEELLVGALPVKVTVAVAGPVAGWEGVGCPLVETVPEGEGEERVDWVALEVGELAVEAEARGVTEGVDMEVCEPAPSTPPPPVRVGKAEAVDRGPVGVSSAEEEGVVVAVLREVFVEVTDTGGTMGAPWEGVGEAEATTVAGVKDTKAKVLRLAKEYPVGSRVQSAATAARVLG